MMALRNSMDLKDGTISMAKKPSRKVDPGISAKLDTAGIRPAHRGMTLPGLGASGKEARAYLESEDYPEDRKSGVGAVFYGTGTNHANILPVFAKELALSGDGVRLVTLSKLVWAVMDNTEAAEELLRAKALCIVRFQMEVDERPFTARECMMVEEFLISRYDNYLRNYLQTCAKLSDLDWWSREFKSVSSPRLRDFHVGQGK